MIFLTRMFLDLGVKAKVELQVVASHCFRRIHTSQKTSEKAWKEDREKCKIVMQTASQSWRGKEGWTSQVAIRLVACIRSPNVHSISPLTTLITSTRSLSPTSMPTLQLVMSQTSPPYPSKVRRKTCSLATKCSMSILKATWPSKTSSSNRSMKAPSQGWSRPTTRTHQHSRKEAHRTTLLSM